MALDAFRGFVMVVLVSNGFGLPALANHPTYAWIARQFNHVAWEGAVFWDLIMPAFLFVAGAAMPFALAKRERPFGHVAARSIRLLLLSQILICISGNKLQFQIVNVLAQLALTYFCTYLILRLRFGAQVVTAVLLLAGHSALFYLFPGPDGPFSKMGNIGAVIDRWWLGGNYSGYYTTLNFLSSIPSTLFGAWAARLIMSPRNVAEKLKILAGSTLVAFASGLALTVWVPCVKRLWTASFAVYSTGWVLVMLIVFFWVFDMRGWRKPAFPLVVVGMNSIFIYSINQVLQGWINRSLAVFTGKFEWLGTPAPIFQSLAVLLVMWYLCYWLYQRKIFLKL